MADDGRAAPARAAALSGSGSRAVDAVLLAVVGAGVLVRIVDWSRARLWLDEYHALIVATAPTLEGVLAYTAAEAHPPLYWVVLHGVMRLLGDDPLVAKGLSVAFGALALVATALAARRAWGPAAATVSAAVLGFSVLAVHFSTEVRPYALVSLTLLTGLLATVAAVERPSPRTVAGEGAALVLALAVSFFALALLPVGPVVAALRRRRRLACHQLLVASLALLVTSSPLVRVATTMPKESSEYLQTIWEGKGPFGVLSAVGRDLLPSWRWAPAYGPGSDRGPADSVLEATAVTGALLVVLGGAVAVRRRREGAGRGELALASVLLLGSAAAMAVLSFVVGRPVVTPGRFAVSFLPAVALLAGAAATWTTAGRAGAALLAAAAAGGAGLHVVRAEPGVGVEGARLTAYLLETQVRGPALVVAVGLTGTPLKYLLRHRADVAFESFPPEIDRHFGWWAPRKALAEPERLAREAAETAGRALAAARSGRTVVVVGADHPVAAPLREALHRVLSARPLHGMVRGAFVLSPRSPPAVPDGPDDRATVRRSNDFG